MHITQIILTIFLLFDKINFGILIYGNKRDILNLENFEEVSIMETQGNVALQNTVDEKSAPLSFGKYLGMMIVSIIPFVGFIMLLVWSFSSKTNANKKNWARAQLVYMIIVGIVAGILGASLMQAFVSAALSMYY